MIAKHTPYLDVCKPSLEPRYRRTARVVAAPSASAGRHGPVTRGELTMTIKLVRDFHDRPIGSLIQFYETRCRHS
jgi:hypothetical protein